MVSKRHETVAEVNGRRFKVAFWVPDSSGSKAPRRSSSAQKASGSGSGNVVAPMQGTIVSLLVEKGSEVKAGDPICVLEAMKMENNVLAERSGVVKEIAFSEGDSVGAGDVIAIIE